MALRVGLASALAVAVGVGLVSGAAATREMARRLSPCGAVMNVATWSPNGKRIAFVGKGSGARAICVADADGKHARPLRDATCPRSGRCRLINMPSELYWLRPKQLVYGDVAKGIFVVPLVGKPRRIGASSDTYGAFTVDAAGNRLAYGGPACCTGGRPVTILSIPSGHVVGKVGGTRVENTNPDLSSDGKQVAFEGARPPGVWIASARGGDLRGVEQCYSDPVWSPTGKWIACIGPPQAWPSGSPLLLPSPQSGATITLVPHGLPSPPNGPIFGWSPNGMNLAFSRNLVPSGQVVLDVVNVATGKVRQRFGPPAASSYVTWSAGSRQMLVTTRCALWRVPALGMKKPQRLLHGNCP